MPTRLRIAHATDRGPRERNEDYAGFATPEADVAAIKGYLAALADGVSGGSHGREAAETTVRNLLADYYATPDTWETAHALRALLAGINRWLAGQIASRREPGGMACTLSALVFRGPRYTLAHVGDSRVYRLRGETLRQLTQDHVWDSPGMEHVLKRAVGLDQHLLADIADGELHAGDRFLICSDGVWQPLGHRELHRLLALYDAPEPAARALVLAALDQGGQDNASALVVHIDAVDGADSLAEMRSARALPLPGRLAPGAHLDGFVIEAVLHDSRETLLYRARQVETGQSWVLKTLQPRLEGDQRLAERLLLEEWIGKRLQSHYFADTLALPGRNFLYIAQRHYPGANLEAKLEAGQHFAPAEIATLGIRLMKGLAALHRLDVVHRDIKPANLHLDEQGKLRILDLGVAWCPPCETIEAAAEGAEQPGTPCYKAPELFQGARADPRADLYAAGVSLYHLLSRKYPYGEVEPFQHPRFGDPVPPSRYRPDIPAWLENVLLKAVVADPAQRFETAEEFMIALERGPSNPLSRPRRSPLAERDPAALWQALAALSLIANLLLLYLLAAG